MARKIVYLINPISGTRAKSSLEKLLRNKTKEKGIWFEIVHSDPQGNYSLLQKKIKEESITDVVICGGDGTINAVANALQGIDVNIGIIPMGSGNGLAFTAKIPKSPARALDIVFRGHASPVDAFMVNDHFSCMLCGIGLDAAVAHHFAKQKSRGLQTYIKTSFVQFFKAKPYLFVIELKGRRFETEAFMISIANSNQFGNNFTIAPKASLTDGLLDIVIVKKMSRMMLAFSIIGQVTGLNTPRPDDKPVSGNHVIYLQTDQLTIRNLGAAPLHIDGDPRSTTKDIRIRIIKDCFRLLH